MTRQQGSSIIQDWPEADPDERVLSDADLERAAQEGKRGQESA